MHLMAMSEFLFTRTVQVVRENGKFGFVIKGSNPAFVETIDSNGPAEKAGLQKGDFLIRLNGMDVRYDLYLTLCLLLATFVVCQ